MSRLSILRRATAGKQKIRTVDRQIEVSSVIVIRPPRSPGPHGHRMQPNVQLRRLEAGDVDPIVAAFDALGWDKPRRQHERYLAEQAEGRRVVRAGRPRDQPSRPPVLGGETVKVDDHLALYLRKQLAATK